MNINSQEPKKVNITLAFIGFSVFALLIFILNISVGSVNIGLSDVFKYITQGLDSSQVNSTILWKIRMPRSIAVIFGGAAIAVMIIGSPATGQAPKNIGLHILANTVIRTE